MRFQVLDGIRIDGAVVTRPQLAKIAAVLLAHRNCAVSVDRLNDAVWDYADASSAGAIHTAISRLRSVVGVDSLLREADAYRLVVAPGDIDLDVLLQYLDDAHSAENDDDALRAIDAGLQLSKGRPFGPLADLALVQPAVREVLDTAGELHALRLALLLKLQRFDDAIRHSDAAITEHPFDERLRAARARALAGSGRRVEALRAIAGYRRFLSEETGLSPSTELLALERTLLNDDESNIEPVPYVRLLQNDAANEPRANTIAAATKFSPVTDGIRRSARTWLRSFLTQSRSETVRTAFLVGDPGMGKTTLIEELAQFARRTGFSVLRGAAHPTLRKPALLWSALHTDSSLSEGPALIDTIIGALTQRLQNNATLLILEDLHWADAVSVDVFSAVLSADFPLGGNLTVVATLRPEVLRTVGEQGAAQLARLTRNSRVENLELKALDRADVETLLAKELGGQPSADLIHELQSRSNGNPLIIATTLRRLQEADALIASDRGILTKGSIEAVIPHDLQEPFASAIDSLSQEARGVLDTLALIGGSASEDLLREATGLAQMALLRALIESEELGLVRIEIGIVRVAHDLVRTAVIAALATSRRQLAHMTIAERLLASSPNPVTASSERRSAVVTQLAGSGNLYRGPVLEQWATLAGHDALHATLWSQAASLFRIAANSSSDPNPALLFLLAKAQFLALDSHASPTAQQAFDLALQQGDAETEGEVARLLFRLSYLDKKADSVRQSIRQRYRRHDIDRVARIRVLSESAQLASYDNDLAEVNVDLQQANELLRPDDPVELHTLITRASSIVALEQLQFASALSLIDKLDPRRSSDWYGSLSSLKAMATLGLGQPAAALQSISDVECQEMTRLRFWADLALLLALKASALSAMGETEHAIEMLNEAARWSSIPASQTPSGMVDLVALFLTRYAEVPSDLVPAARTSVPTRILHTADNELVVIAHNLLDRSSPRLSGFALAGVGATLAAETTDQTLRTRALQTLRSYLAQGVEVCMPWPIRLDTLAALLETDRVLRRTITGLRDAGMRGTP
jgi:DNA-binding SARP family transcriptional activator/Holliday junction resolvasome RuvABC ATP-dependent DNA helicase subunit